MCVYITHPFPNHISANTDHNGYDRYITPLPYRPQNCSAICTCMSLIPPPEPDVTITTICTLDRTNILPNRDHILPQAICQYTICTGYWIGPIYYQIETPPRPAITHGMPARASFLACPRSSKCAAPCGLRTVQRGLSSDVYCTDGTLTAQWCGGLYKYNASAIQVQSTSNTNTMHQLYKYNEPVIQIQCISYTNTVHQLHKYNVSVIQIHYAKVVGGKK